MLLPDYEMGQIAIPHSINAWISMIAGGLIAEVTVVLLQPLICIVSNA